MEEHYNHTVAAGDLLDAAAIQHNWYRTDGRSAMCHHRGGAQLLAPTYQMTVLHLELGTTTFLSSDNVSVSRECR